MTDLFHCSLSFVLVLAIASGACGSDVARGDPAGGAPHQPQTQTAAGEDGAAGECAVAPARPRTCPNGVLGPDLWEIENIPFEGAPFAPELKIDNSGALHAVTVTTTTTEGEKNEYVQYATNVSGAWVVETLASATNSPDALKTKAPRIAINGCGDVDVLYHRTLATKQFYLVRKKKADPASRTEEIAPLPRSPEDPSPAKEMSAADIAYDKTNTLHFVGRTEEAVEIMARDGSRWKRTTPHHIDGRGGVDLPVFAAGSFDAVPPFLVGGSDRSPKLVGLSSKTGTLFESVISAKVPLQCLHLGSPPLAAEMDAFGTMHVIWNADNGLHYARTPGGNTEWSTPQEIVMPSSEHGSGIFNVKLAVASEERVLYVSASSAGAASIQRRAIDTDPSTTWQTSALPTDAPPAQGQAIAVDGGGRLFVLQASGSTTRLLKQKCAP